MAPKKHIPIQYELPPPDKRRGRARSANGLFIKESSEGCLTKLTMKDLELLLLEAHKVLKQYESETETTSHTRMRIEATLIELGHKIP